jgi:hypothetical protein
MEKMSENLNDIAILIDDKLPEGPDVFGYAGVTRSILAGSLLESNSLCEAIEASEVSFDIILFKRDLDKHIHHCREFLESLPNDDQEKEFNRFLNHLGQIRKIVLTTYLLVVKKALRPETELAEIRTALEEILPENEKLLKSHEDAKAKFVEIQAWHDQCLTLSTSADTHGKQVATALENVKALAKEVQDHHLNAGTWTTTIETIREDITDQKSSISENQKGLETQMQDADLRLKMIVDSQKKLDGQLEKNAEFQEEIRNILDDSNRSSMAGSFMKRKTELDKPLKRAEVTLVVVLLAFAAVTLYLFIGDKTDVLTYSGILKRVVILSPFIWLAWFYTSKVGHLTRIREDYSFKYAAAMAFEGYKKNCQDEELAKLLLKVSIENMGANPIRIYGNDGVPSGPFAELMDKGGKAANHIGSALKGGGKS